MSDSDIKPMRESELQSIVHGLISDATSYVDGELSPVRKKATEYYHGRPFGNEEEGRSQVVQTTVRDTILAALPDLLKLFFGAERVVEFVPRNAAGVEQAKQATDYIQKIFAEDCGGFLLAHGAIKDGLLKRIGALKHGIVDGDVEVFELENVSESQLQQLAADDSVTLTKVEQTGTIEVPPADPQVAGTIGVQSTAEAVYRVSASKQGERKLAVWGVPPEELIFPRTARDKKSAVLFGHRTEKSRSDLIAMGISEEDIDEFGGTDSSLEGNPERVARNPAETGPGSHAEAGEANDEILYVEAYVLVDADGDKIAELRKICTIGTSYHIVDNEAVDDCPIHFWTPDPEPHAIIGQSLADLTMDLQLTESSLMRGILDSAAASLFPRIAMQEGQVSVQDVLNTEIGAPIRTKGIPSNNLQSFSHQFTGQNLIPILQEYTSIRERRTGMNPGSMGIDADALQSSTKQAVGAAVTASQARVELLGRFFAEMLLKPLFRGMLKQLVALQPRKTMTRLRGKWVEIDPASWDANMDVTVNVALGTTAVDGKLETLLGVKDTQESILQQLGPGNPLVHLSQYFNTLADILELKGFKDATRYFTPVAEDWAPPAPDPSQQQETPEQTLAKAQMQIEEMKARKDLQIKQAELTLKQQDSARAHQFEVAKAAADIELRRLELQLKYSAEMDQRAFDQEMARIEAQLEGARTANEDARATDAHEHGKAVTEAELEHRQQLEREAQEHDQQIAEQQAAAASQEGTGE